MKNDNALKLEKAVIDWAIECLDRKYPEIMELDISRRDTESIERIQEATRNATCLFNSERFVKAIHLAAPDLPLGAEIFAQLCFIAGAIQCNSVIALSRDCIRADDMKKALLLMEIHKADMKACRMLIEASKIMTDAMFKEKEKEQST